MAFKDIDRMLLEECVKDILDFKKIEALIIHGADINAYDAEYEQSLYDGILDYFIDNQGENVSLTNLLAITEFFVENGLLLNPKPEKRENYIPRRFRFLPPDEMCVNLFKMLLDTGKSSFEELSGMIGDATLDLHLNEYYFYEQTQYTKEDSLQYYLELIYWACAYQVRAFPDRCSKELLSFHWFERDRNKVEFIRGNRSTSVVVEDVETHNRAEIQGWSFKY